MGTASHFELGEGHFSGEPWELCVGLVDAKGQKATRCDFRHS